MPNKANQNRAMQMAAAENPVVAALTKLKLKNPSIPSAEFRAASPPTASAARKITLPSIKGAIQNLRALQLPSLITDRLALLEEIVIAKEIVYVGEDPTKILSFQKNYCRGVDDAATLDNIRKIFKLVFSTKDSSGNLMFAKNPLPPCEESQRIIISAGIQTRLITLQEEIDGLGGVDTQLLRTKMIQKELLYELTNTIDGDKCENYLTGQIKDVASGEVNDNLKDLIRTFIFMMLQNMGSISEYSSKDDVAKDIIMKLKKNAISRTEMQTYLSKWRSVSLSQGKDIPNVISGILLNMDEFTDLVQKMRDSDSDVLVASILSSLGNAIVVSPDQVSILIGTIRAATDDAAAIDAQTRLNILYNTGDISGQIIENLIDTFNANILDVTASKRILKAMYFIITNGGLEVEQGRPHVIHAFVPIIKNVLTSLQNTDTGLVHAAGQVLDTFVFNDQQEFITAGSAPIVMSVLNKNSNGPKNASVAYFLAKIIDDFHTYAMPEYKTAMVDAGAVAALTQAYRANEAILHSLAADAPTKDVVTLASSAIVGALAVLGFKENGSSIATGGGRQRGGDKGPTPAPDFASLIAILQSPDDTSKDKLLKFILEVKDLYGSLQAQVQGLLAEKAGFNDKIQMLQDSVNTKQAELDTANATSADLQAQLSGLNTRVTALTESNQHATDSLDLLQARYDTDTGELKEDNATKQGLLDTARTETQGLNEANDALNKKMAMLRMQVDQLNVVLAPLKGALDQANNLNLELASDNKDMARVLTEVTKEKAVAVAAADAAQALHQRGGDAPAQATVQSTVQTVNPGIIARDVENRGLQDIIEYLRQYNATTRLDKAYVASLKMKVDDLQGKYEACKQQNYNLQRKPSVTTGGGKTAKAKAKAKKLRLARGKLTKVQAEYNTKVAPTEANKGKLNFLELAVKFTDMIHKKATK